MSKENDCLRATHDFADKLSHKLALRPFALLFACGPAVVVRIVTNTEIAQNILHVLRGHGYSWMPYEYMEWVTVAACAWNTIVLAAGCYMGDKVENPPTQCLCLARRERRRPSRRVMITQAIMDILLAFAILGATCLAIKQRHTAVCFDEYEIVAKVSEKFDNECGLANTSAPLTALMTSSGGNYDVTNTTNASSYVTKAECNRTVAFCADIKGFGQTIHEFGPFPPLINKTTTGYPAPGLDFSIFFASVTCLLSFALACQSFYRCRDYNKTVSTRESTAAPSTPGQEIRSLTSQHDNVIDIDSGSPRSSRSTTRASLIEPSSKRTPMMLRGLTFVTSSLAVASVVYFTFGSPYAETVDVTKAHGYTWVWHACTAMAAVDLLVGFWCIYQLCCWRKKRHHTAFHLGVDTVLVLLIGAGFSLGVFYLLSPVCLSVEELKLNCTNCVGFCADLSDFCKTMQKDLIPSVNDTSSVPPVYGLEAGVAFTFLTFLLAVGSTSVSLYEHLKLTNELSRVDFIFEGFYKARDTFMRLSNDVSKSSDIARLQKGFNTILAMFFVINIYTDLQTTADFKKTQGGTLWIVMLILILCPTVTAWVGMMWYAHKYFELKGGVNQYVFLLHDKWVYTLLLFVIGLPLVPVLDVIDQFRGVPVCGTAINFMIMRATDKSVNFFVFLNNFRAARETSIMLFESFAVGIIQLYVLVSRQPVQLDDAEQSVDVLMWAVITSFCELTRVGVKIYFSATRCNPEKTVSTRYKLLVYIGHMMAMGGGIVNGAVQSIWDNTQEEVMVSNERVDDRHVSMIARAIRYSDNDKLKILDLSQNLITAKGVTYLCEAMRMRATAEMKEKKKPLAQKGVRRAKQVKYLTLEYVSLAGNRIGDLHQITFLKCERAKAQPSDRELHLKVRIDGEDGMCPVVFELSSELAGAHVFLLKEFGRKGTQIGDTCAAGDVLLRIGKSLVSATSLTKLGDTLCTPGIKKVLFHTRLKQKVTTTAGVKKKTTRRSLTEGGGQRVVGAKGDVAAVQFAHTITHCSTDKVGSWPLRMLDLSNCGIGDSGFLALFDALKDLKWHFVLDLSDNQISERGVKRALMVMNNPNFGNWQTARLSKLQHGLIRADIKETCQCSYCSSNSELQKSRNSNTKILIILEGNNFGSQFFKWKRAKEEIGLEQRLNPEFISTESEAGIFTARALDFGIDVKLRQHRRNSNERAVRLHGGIAENDADDIIREKRFQAKGIEAVTRAKQGGERSEFDSAGMVYPVKQEDRHYR